MSTVIIPQTCISITDYGWMDGITRNYTCTTDELMRLLLTVATIDSRQISDGVVM